MTDTSATDRAAATSEPIDWLAEFEGRVLSAIVVHSESSPRAFDLVADRLTSDDFSNKPFSEVWHAVCELAEDGEVITAPTVWRKLRSWGRSSDEVSAVMLGPIAEHSFPRPSERSLLSFAVGIRRASRDRQIKALGARIVDASGADSERALTDAWERIARLQADAADAEPDEDGAPLLDEAAQSLLHAKERGADILRTGLVDVDRIFTAGLAPRTMSILAALTSRGKTSLALQIADLQAARVVAGAARGIVRFISLEMGAAELHKRRLISASGVPLDVWEDRMPRSGGEAQKLEWARQELRRRPLRITYGGGITIEQVAAICRRDASRTGLALVVVDYLQALDVRAGGKRDDTREREVARMARGLKALALDLEVPVLALAQLSRAADQTERPSLSHLRESGAIEQFADNVLFLYQRPKDEASVVTVRIAKQRNGARDVEQRAFFDGRRFTFANYSEE